MSRRFDRDDLARYRDRDWAGARASKETHWRSQGPEEALRVFDQLWAHAQLVDPHWPDAAERRADLDHHLRFASRLARLADVFRS